MTIAAAAFAHATPQVVTLDGVRGAFFSRRLHHALVRFVPLGVGSRSPPESRKSTALLALVRLIMG